MSICIMNKSQAALVALVFAGGAEAFHMPSTALPSQRLSLGTPLAASRTTTATFLSGLECSTPGDSRQSSRRKFLSGTGGAAAFGAASIGSPDQAKAAEAGPKLPDEWWKEKVRFSHHHVEDSSLLHMGDFGYVLAVEMCLCSGNVCWRWTCLLAVDMSISGGHVY